MEPKTVFPNVNMLPIEAIKETLQDQLTAKNTLSVGGLTAAEVAKCYNGDQNAVKTAYYLGDKTAKDFLTTENDPTLKLIAMQEIYEKELAAMRLEVYRLYGLLSRTSRLNYQAEIGYIEYFQRNRTPLKTTTATAVVQNGYAKILYPAAAHFAIPQEYIVIEVNNTKYVVQVESIADGAITLVGSRVPLSSTKEVTLYKLKGEFTNSSYSCSQTIKESVTNNTHNIVLGDYAQYEDYSLKSYLGYASSLMVRSNTLSLEGETNRAVLDSIRFHLSKNGMPLSTLVCRIYRITDYIDDVPTLNLIGESPAILPSEASGLWKTVKILTSEGMPLIIEADTELLIAFESIASTPENCYVIRLGSGAQADLHTNRKIYVKEKNNAYLYMPSGKDILLSLNLKAILSVQSIPFNEGLYTSEIIKTAEQNVRKARFSMRFTKDRTAKIQLDNIVDGYNGFSVIGNINGEIGQSFVVGNRIATLKAKQGNTYKTNEHISVYNNDDIYFLPFDVQLLCYPDHFSTGQAKTVKMKLADVHVRSDQRLSDYIIYECEIPVGMNLFQVQVAYEDITKTENGLIEFEEITLSFVEGINF